LIGNNVHLKIKKKYEEKAKDLKEEYTLKFEEYKKSDEYKQHVSALKKFKDKKQEKQDQESDENSDNDSSNKKKGGKNTKPKRKTKKPTDPNGPKKSQTSFFHFSKESRPKLQQQYPEHKSTELAKLIGEAWQALSEEEKKAYQEKAKQDKIRYDEEMNKYKETKDYKEFMKKLNDWKIEQQDGDSDKNGKKKGGNNNNNGKKK